MKFYLPVHQYQQRVILFFQAYLNTKRDKEKPLPFFQKYCGFVSFCGFCCKAEPKNQMFIALKRRNVIGNAITCNCPQIYESINP